MSVQKNQYYIYGVLIPYQWHKNWEKKNNQDFHDTFCSFMDDTAYSRNVNHKDGIFCLFDGMDGDYIIIGRVLNKSDNHETLFDGKPTALHRLTESEEELIKNSIKRNFGEEHNEFDYYFITHYR